MCTNIDIGGIAAADIRTMVAGELVRSRQIRQKLLSSWMAYHAPGEGLTGFVTRFDPPPMSPRHHPLSRAVLRRCGKLVREQNWNFQVRPENISGRTSKQKLSLSRVTETSHDEKVGSKIPGMREEILANALLLSC
jgi:hypothetical protein